MKSKTPLTLIELTIMLLVFALAAALCLQAFSTADRISDESVRRDCAVTDAQSVAEVLKGCEGDFDRAVVLLGGEWNGEIWVIPKEEYTIRVTAQERSHPLLEEAEIRVCAPDDSEVFTLSTVWQKEGSGHE